MTDIQFNCSECGKPVNADQKHSGSVIRCPECGERTLVPEPLPASAPNPTTRVRTLWLFLSSALWGLVLAPILNMCTTNPSGRVSSIGFSIVLIFLLSFCLSRGIADRKSFLWHLGFTFLCGIFAAIFQWRGMLFFGL